MVRMDEMPSAQFRREYAKLTRATLVTVNGHPIGMWSPAADLFLDPTDRVASEPGVRARLGGRAAAEAIRDKDLKDLTVTSAPKIRVRMGETKQRSGVTLDAGYNSRPFRPVPKVKK